MNASLPDERVDPDKAWPMELMTSRCPYPEVDCARRIDPYWDSLWPSSSNAAWLSSPHLRRQSQAGLIRNADRLMRDPQVAIRRVQAMKDFDSRMRMLASLMMWRTLTGEQAAAMSGFMSVLDPLSNPMAALFGAELVDIGTFIRDQFRTLKANRVSLYRPFSSAAFAKLIEPMLTWPEWVAVTGGWGWSTSRQFDRHNLLTSEFMLRMCEYATISTVLGERFSTTDQLVGSGLGAQVPRHAATAADGVIVRPDGLRIAVELTASSGMSFESKVDRWARTLSDTPFSHTGVVVLFLTCSGSNPDEAISNRENLHQRALTQIAHAARAHPGALGDRVAERMFTCSWRELFPGPGLISPRALSLRAWAPTGPVNDVWEEHDLLGDEGIEFSPWNREKFEALTVNAQVMAGIPHWIRDPSQGPQLWRTMLESQGFGDGVPSLGDQRMIPLDEVTVPSRLLNRL